MKYIFIIQGEGRGHLTQAMTLEMLLESRGHEVVEMLVGKSPTRKLPAFFTEGIHAKLTCFESVNFATSADGKHPSILKSIWFNTINASKIIPSISLIAKRIKESGADAVVNFYEMLGTVGYWKSGQKVPMFCIAHQFLFLHKDMRLPRKGFAGHGSLNFFSRCIALGSRKMLALSFRAMNDDGRIAVVPPLLRPALLAYRKSPEFVSGNYILGYILNAGFAEEVMAWHKAHPEVHLHFFWDNAAEAPVKVVDETLSFYYLDDKEFMRQMAGCGAYASTAGFESICEAMYLGKPLMMVPSHIEQQCNAYDATRFCAAVSSDKFNLDVLLEFSKNGRFHPDRNFPEWAESASNYIVSALEDV